MASAPERSQDRYEDRIILATIAMLAAVVSLEVSQISRAPLPPTVALALVLRAVFTNMRRFIAFEARHVPSKTKKQNVIRAINK